MRRVKLHYRSAFNFFPGLFKGLFLNEKKKKSVFYGIYRLRLNSTSAWNLYGQQLTLFEFLQLKPKPLDGAMP